MKHGKTPTKAQAILIKQSGLNYANWLVIKDTSTELVIVHRHSDETMRTIKKEM